MAQEFTNQLQPGMRIGKYQVVSLIATGGMSMLYKAYDKTLDRYVAVKQIAPNLAADEKFVERFRREAQTLARVSQGQQNVVGVYELIEEAGGLFMIMEFVEGTSLQVLMDRGAASLQTGLGILLKVALGLKAIHGQGLVHRDLKPDNVMVQPSGNVKIADFGLVGRAGGRTSLPMGTTQYMAPEMFAGGTVDGRADIYSLGFIAYQMFAGPEKFREVFSDVLADPQSANIRWMHWHSNPAMVAASLRDVQPGVPPLVARIVERMMDKNASRRFNSADQIIKWLRQIFVMYVQGQSLSEQDSAKLEEQVVADIEGGDAAPAATRSTVPAAAAAGTMPVPASQGGPVEPALKTAPLAKRPWHWQDYAKWGGIAAGVLIVVLIGFSVYGNIQAGKQRDIAKTWLNEAEALFNDGDYDAAVREFTNIEKEYREKDMASVVALAHYWRLRSHVTSSIKEKKWKDADQWRQRLMKAVDKWNDGPRKEEALESIASYESMISQQKYLTTLLNKAREAENDGNFQSAKLFYEQINNEGLHENRSEIEQRVRDMVQRQAEADADTKIDDADRFLSRSGQPTEKHLSEARAMYQDAQQTFDGPKVKKRIASVGVAIQIVRLWESISADMKAEKWRAAADKSDRVFELLEKMDDGGISVISREDLKQRANEAKAKALLAQAKAEREGGNRAEAIRLATEALGIDPSLQEAHVLIKQLTNAAEGAKLLEKAAQLEKAGDVMGAKVVLEQLIAMETDSGLKAALQNRIMAMMQRHFKREFYRFRDKKEWDEALAALAEFEHYGGPKRDCERMDREIKNLMNWYMLFDKGKALLEKGQYDEAKGKFVEAMRIPVGAARLRDARDMSKECDYQKYMKLGREAMAAGKYGEARGYFGIAQKYKSTKEVGELLKELEGK